MLNKVNRMKPKKRLGGTFFFRGVKRASDIVMSILLMPLVVIFGLILLLVNPFFNIGPLFYTQSRLGRHLQPFKMYKFRTMTGDNVDSKFATAEAHRISPFAKFLRKTYVDEIPQLYNVLKGEMSFLGPRPEQKRFVQQYLKEIPSYEDRHAVRPGISGLAQVEMGYTDDVNGAEDKLCFDLNYIRNSGFKMELFIIQKTIVTIVKRFFVPESKPASKKSSKKTIA